MKPEQDALTAEALEEHGEEAVSLMSAVAPISMATASSSSSSITGLYQNHQQPTLIPLTLTPVARKSAKVTVYTPPERRPATAGAASSQSTTANTNTPSMMLMMSPTVEVTKLAPQEYYEDE